MESKKADEERKRNIKIALETYNRVRSKSVKIIEQIGFGGCAIVYKVKEPGKEPYVLKAVDSGITSLGSSNEKINLYTREEIKALKKGKSCDYIMDIIEAFDYTIDITADRHIFLIFLPLLQTSIDYFEESAANFTVDNIIEMTKDIALALSFIHKEGVLHRDVKGANIYWDKTKNNFVLGDFGVSRSSFNFGESVTRIGPGWIIAPEIFNYKPLNGKFNSDIYTLGKTTLNFLYLLTRGLPLSEAIKKRAEEKDPHGIKSENVIREITDEFLSEIKPVELSNILRKSIEDDPDIRYQTGDELFNALNRLYPSNNKVYPSNKNGCCSALLNKDLKAAESIARENIKNDDTFACALAYILSIQKKNVEALNVLLHCQNIDTPTVLGLIGMIGLQTNGQDKEEHFNILENAAEDGFSPAQYLVGRMYIQGDKSINVSIDVNRGLDFIHKSIGADFRPAMSFYIKYYKKFTSQIYDDKAFLDVLQEKIGKYTPHDYPFDLILAIFGLTYYDVNEILPNC